MATINPTINNDVAAQGGVRVVKWALVTTGDVGAPIRLDRWSVASMQLFGTTITAFALNGSNDPDAPTNWTPLKDWAGGSLGALAAAGFYTPRDLPIWIQPVLTTGATVTVQLALHRGDMSMVG